MDLLSNFFNSSGFLPHGHCYLWTPSLLWTDVVSDLIIGASYFSIPVALWVFAQKRKDLPYKSMFVLFGVFVIACGSTHLVDVWNIWHTAYWADAGLTTVTALASAATAVMLWRLMPLALSIPSRAELENANSRLLDEVSQRERVESALRTMNRTLKVDAAARTSELTVARKDLQRFHAFLAAIIQSSDAAIVSSDMDGNVLSWNPAAESLYGYSADEMIGKSVDLLSPVDLRQDMAETFRAIRSGKRAIARVETKRVRKDSREIDVSLSIFPVMSGDGEIVAIASVGRDISEQKLAEERLRAESEKFQGIVEQPLAGIYMVQDRKFAFVNARGAEIVGATSSSEVIGTDPLEWVADGDRAEVGEYMRQLESGEAKNLAFEFKALRRDGAVVDVGLNAARATNEGRLALVGLLQDISEKKRAAEEIEQYVNRLHIALLGSIQIATKIGELRDPYTAGHENRVAELAVAIGAELGLDNHALEGLRVAGQLHDVGKIVVPAEILAKPTKLTPAEYDLVKEHPSAGYEILKIVDFPWPVALVALQHHERLDGSGYPQGLRGREIIMEARITAVADVVEAMSSHRPYRPGKGIESALAEIEQGRGQIYDAEAVDACLRLFRDKDWKLPT